MSRRRFPDLSAGGRALVSALAPFGAEADLVIGIAAGGVPAAWEVAQALQLPVDITVKKSVFLRGPGDPACFVSVAGRLIADGVIVLDEPSTPFEICTRDALGQLETRVRACRGDRPAVPVEGKTVLLVDDGIRTGETMRASARALRAAGVVRLIAAAPVAATEGGEVVRESVDELVVLDWPASFGNAAMFYDRFDVPDDAAVRALLDRPR